MVKLPPPDGSVNVSDIRVRPASNGYIVSHYRNTNKNTNPGTTVETYHATHDDAAAHMAQLAKAQKDQKDLMAYGPSPAAPPVQ